MGTLVLYLRGTDIRDVQGTEVWGVGSWGGTPDDTFCEITEGWDWSTTPHLHYRVGVVAHPPGSYWVPTSTHPPASKKKTWVRVTTTYPHGNHPIPLNRPVYRPEYMFIWIPASFFQHENSPAPGGCSNYIICEESVPDTYPPKKRAIVGYAKDKKESKSKTAEVKFSPPSPTQSTTSASSSPSNSPDNRSTSMDLSD